ncbi:hypothetical protein KIN20_024366 [Parelaphostrongylus tenuis]|uniref:Uncharacterized protein n=1 Tax=Parelaphostrongylus tenuis TaxID=148309 RepID=A0AAD5QTM2_PARTN|nr:hypothetical protein KIN20_024366 [Parelaphostrongylus tenuis]
MEWLGESKARHQINDRHCWKKEKLTLVGHRHSPSASTYSDCNKSAELGLIKGNKRCIMAQWRNEKLAAFHHRRQPTEWRPDRKGLEQSALEYPCVTEVKMMEYD